ncbi:MAG: GntR family transcriptional regulator [Proteobacteria bacterium]|nr:GntR family transcriptional regulator [Pseudomonadota bacterium]
MFRLDLQPSSATPLYRQIVDQVTRAVAAGALRDGDELPSVRAVAQQYVINPMTVSKAYSLLEAQGVLERRRGMGMLVRAREGEGAATGERLALLQPALEQAARAARQLGIAPDDALAAFQQTLLQSMPGDDGQETPHEY